MEASARASRADGGIGTATAASSSSSPTPTSAPTRASRAQPALSVSELRAALQHELRQNGVLQNLKTQLRGSVLTELMKKQKAAALSPAHRTAARSTAKATRAGEEGEGEQIDTKKDALDTMDLDAFESQRRDVGPRGTATATPGGALGSWAGRVSDALVENHLRRTRRPMSLSIFSTEAEVAPFSGIGAPSEEEQYLRRLLRCGHVGEEKDGVEMCDAGVRTSAAAADQSLLQQLVASRLMEETNEASAASHRHSCSTQTDDTAHSDVTNPLTSMECRLAAVDAKYALTFSQLKQNGADHTSTFFTRSEVDRRLEQYRQDIREQLTNEFQAKYRAFEQGKLQHAKAEHEARYQTLVQMKAEEWRETERSLVMKVEQERQRLALAREDVERQKIALAQRQRDVASLVRDHEIAYEDLQRQLRDAKEACRLLQLQGSKWEEVCGSRLVELESAKSRDVRRVEDMRRMQAEFAAELRLKDEDIARLQFRIRTLLSQRGGGGGTRGGPGHTTGEETARGSPESTTDRVQEDLYHVLVRTEELQRNALRQQQQTWEHAWNTRGTTASSVAPVDRLTPQKEHDDERQPLAPQQQPQQQQQQPRSTASVPSDSHVSESPAAVSPIAAVSTRLSSHSGSGREKGATPSLASAQNEASPLAASASLEMRAATQGASAQMEKKKSSLSSSSQPPLAAEPASSSSSSSSSPSRPQPSSMPSSSHSTPAKPLEDEESGADVGENVSKPPAAHPASSPTGSHRSGSSGRSSVDISVDADHDNSNDENDEKMGNEEAESEAAVNTLVADEVNARTEIQDGEKTARAGIQWSESSQREVIHSQESEREQASGGDAAGGGGGGARALGFIDQLAQQRAQEALERDNIIYRDDDDEDDSILFGGKSDGTDESF